MCCRNALCLTAALALMTAVIGLAISEANGEEASSLNRVIPRDVAPIDQSKWSLDDLLSGQEESLRELREKMLSGEALRLQPRAALRGGGTMDIGEIAVIEDDGTLVVGGTTNSTNILNAFFATHGDEYDIVAIYVAGAFPGDPDPEAGFAFFSGAAGFVAGIGSGQGNGNEANGFTRLTGFVNMNDLDEYPADPNADFLGGVASGVEIMGQEALHAWAAFVQAQGADILGRGEAHWSFFLSHPGGSGNASPMEGNIWTDNGDGSFTTVESFNGFSPLDDYVMGLRPPANVPGYFLITNPSPAFDDSSFPATGVVVTGNRVDLSVNDIIALHGDRLPATDTSIKTIKMAFMLIIPQGTTATVADLDKLNGIRTEWETYFNTTTEGLGTIDSTLSAGAPTALPFADTFDSGPRPDDANWQWWQGPVVNSLGLNEPTGDSSLNLNGNWGGGDEIRSRVIDLSSFASGEVSLDYSTQRTGGGDSPEGGEDLLIEYFSDISTWEILRTIAGGGADETAFTAFSDTLPDDALHANFRFRFHRLQGSIGDFDDYFVDDVSIQTGVAPPCPADFDGDGFVLSSDFAFLLGSWGPNPGSQADLDGDGFVLSADLALLLGQWGPCP